MPLVWQRAWRGLKCAGLISFTVRAFPGWTGGKLLCLRTTTTPGPSAPSASPACTTRAPRPPARSPPFTRATATPARCPRPPWPRRPTPAPICTLSPPRHQRTCLRIRGPRLRAPRSPGWTKRTLLNIKCPKAWRWRDPVLCGAAYPRWAPRLPPRTTPSPPTPPTPSQRPTSTAAACSTRAACWDPRPASRTKARHAPAPVSRPRRTCRLVGLIMLRPRGSVTDKTRVGII